MAPRSSRRGVLLMVVLAMLVLFMLIGTTFLMSSNSARMSAKVDAKANRLSKLATKHLDSALFTLLRDTENPHSTPRTHSLLRDLYGTDGFQAVATSATYARRIANPPAGDISPLGSTQGQLIDIFVTPSVPPIDIPQTPTIDESKSGLSLKNVIKLDRDGLGRPQLHVLPRTRGYYNGCLLTVTSGGASGQSTRIVDYEFVGDDPSIQKLFGQNGPINCWRFRVMTIGRSDGGSLASNAWPVPPLPPPLISPPPAITELVGATILVNGRAFSGTGVGYNPLAAAGTPRLNAVQFFPTSTSEGLGVELSLTPNSRYFVDPQSVRALAPGVPDPFAPALPNADFLPLNPAPALPLNPTPAQLAAYAASAAQWKYPNYIGPGGGNEDYDAPDFQNLILALQTVTPRARARVVQRDDTKTPADPDSLPDLLEVDDPDVDPSQFLRLDLEDLPLPSFHRPDLVNFWYHRILNLLVAGGMDAQEAARAILTPYDANWNPTPPLNPGQAALIAAIKRKIMLRPIREDHPKFDGGNSLSAAPNLNGIQTFVVGNQIAVPYWEVTGPWDVDNDNDGVPDSIWVDLGDPVQEAEDGTRYKPLYAILCIDLDNRLNVNAHGLVDHINYPVGNGNLAAVTYPGSSQLVSGPNLAGTTAALPFSSDQLATGLGYGPAEISLRPVFPAPLNAAGNPVEGNRVESAIPPGAPIDSYTTLLAGRVRLDGSAVPGKYGFDLGVAGQSVTAGTNYQFAVRRPNFRDDPATLPDSQLWFTGERSTPDRLAQFKFFDYPWSIVQLSHRQTSFGTPPDLKGRYALGIDYAGQPVYEVSGDVNLSDNTLPRNLLAKSPYELNLSSPQRRDTWGTDYPDAATAFNSTVDFSMTGGQVGISDDAAFATTDLERILRAFDADVGTLPSRLWDVVDVFDPVKLTTFDRYRVQAIARLAFNDPTISANDPNDAPQMLAAAQQTSAISRRLVTTDSVDLPVIGGSKPNYINELGPDGAPGRAGTDPPVASSIGMAGSDDFQSILEKPLTQATLTDLLYYRVFLELRKNYILTQGWQEPLNAAQATQLNTYIAAPNGLKAQTAILAAGSLAQSLLAPELIAGKRMDLNRPFGDGRDNNGDGIVDDSLEAGDPFLDIMNAVGDPVPDGKYQVGEPYINLDGSVDGAGDPTYSPPRDQLWQGLTGEPIAFDYTNGVGVPIHPAVAGAAFPPTAQVRNLESQARQLYARHLYCLMLLLVDEGYIAPVDENDPQFRKYLDTTINNSTAKNILDALTALPTPPPDPAQETRRILLRKLTCRMIAQWAINCVDMRDSDATMTPFEYDEYPWDGWGVPIREPADPSGAIVSFLPIDGDAATDENIGAVINWSEVAAQRNTKQIIKLDALTPPVTLPLPLDQTRGVVWGAERPDLLITETFAFHDRRTEDTNSDWTRGYLDTLEFENRLPPNRSTLDQRLRPRGGLFVEVYNPWAQTGQHPAEVYSLFDTTSGRMVERGGIELGRLSTYGAEQISPTERRLTAAINPAGSTNIKRSPVWRIIVVEENPVYRQLPTDDTFDNPNNQNTQTTRIHTGNPSAHYTGGTGRYFEAADPDSIQFDPLLFAANEPYIERSFYFTSDNSPRFNNNIVNRENMGLVSRPDDRLRIPPQVVVNNVPKSVNYFIASDVREANVPNATDIRDVPIAPIKPGRYAVIGTAGAQYTGLEVRNVQTLNANGDPVVVPDVPRFVTTLSRLVLSSSTQTAPTTQTDDNQHWTNLDKTRRVELLPSPNPEVQQVFVAANGGIPLFPMPGDGPNEPVQRENEVVKLPPGLGAPYPQGAAERFRNIFDADNDGNPDPLLVPPCVAIPVANMSASEPLDLYRQLRTNLRQQETDLFRALTPAQQNTAKSPGDHYWNPLAARGEGAYVTTQTGLSPDPYNEPFDQAPEMLRNGTTRNYRTIHLQRLADPTLPWNPPPNGRANDPHDPKLPVNVYRTIDTASVDLTAYNGASSKEPDDPTTGVVNTYARYLPEQGGQQANMFERVFGVLGRSQAPRHRLSYRSLERGWHRTDRTTAGELALVPRQLWRQEPETRFADVAPDVINNGVYANDMAEWKVLNNPGARQAELRKRVNDVRIRNSTALTDDIDAASGIDPEFSSLPPLGDANETRVPLRPRKHHFDFVAKHTLGFQNESFGALTTRADVIGQNLPVSSYGTPMRDQAAGPNEKFSRTLDNGNATLATYPWLAWHNRPLVSAGELLQVPATSSSQMLRKHTTIDPTPGNNPPNPYDGTRQPNNERLERLLAPFGHLLNFFSTSDQPTQILPPTPPATDNQFVGAPHFYRILDYVHVPSRFVGTDDMLTAEIFNDVPVSPTFPTEPIGGDILGPSDPRYYFQPPFNKVSRERDPGKVNLNTVTGRRIPPDPNSDPPIAGRHWSEVFDGLMQRDRDGNFLDASGNPRQLGHGGPAWRDIVLSRRGYAQMDAAGTLVDKSPPPSRIPDAFQFGLNSNFPTFFSNPFRSAEAGDLVPLPQMLRYGIDASWLRGHHFNRGPGVWGRPADPNASPPFDGDDNDDGSIDDTREAGFGGDMLSVNSLGALIPTFGAGDRGIYPLFSESFTAPYVDGERNPYFYYQPMTRLGNLVTTRSNVYAIWITVGYFEVEPAPDFNSVSQRFGGDGNATSPATIAAQALYNRVYPDGYMLGKEVGSDTGDIHRHRGFYIIDRSEPVGFKPGEDLNVERTIRLRRRIE